MATKGKVIPVIWWWNKVDNEGNEVNASYLHITNSYPTEVPYYNSYRNWFTNTKSRSDRWDTAWNARKPAHQCAPNNEVIMNACKRASIDVASPDNFFTRDSIECWWERFFLFRSNNPSDWCDDKFLIWKQCNASYKQWCDYVYKNCCASWAISVIWSFPIKDCTYDKFTKMNWPIWKPKYETCEWVLRVDKVGDYLFWTIYDDSWNNITASVGDWVYIKEDNWPFKANAWFLNQVTWTNFPYSCNTTANGAANLVMSAPWPDIVPISDNWFIQSATTQSGDVSAILEQFFSTVEDNEDNTDWVDEDGNDVCSSYEYKNVCICIYKEVWETFWFATSNWVYLYTWDDACDWDEDNEGEFVLLPNSWNDEVDDCEWWVTITSVFNYYGQTWYIVNGSIILNSTWSFLTDSVLDADSFWYTDAVPVNDLLVFVWPNSAWALTNTWTSNQLSPIFSKNGSGIWYFNKWSYVNRLEDFYMISNWWHLYQLSFSSSLVENTWQLVFKPVLNDLDLYIRHDLGMLDKAKWDYAYLSANEDTLDIFIWSEWDNYTQIWSLDRHDWNWYDQKICDAQIIWKQDDGCYIWTNGIYNFDWWGKQVESSVTQLISWIVDTSRSNRKYFDFIRIDVWYNSNISTNTILRVKIIDDWCESIKDFRLDNFQYIKDLNEQKLTSPGNYLSTNGLTAKFPQKAPTQEPCFKDEMKAFCKYKPTKENVMTHCTKDLEDVDCNWFWDHTEEVKVATYATLHFPLSCHGSIMKRELISHSWDNVEYLSAYMEMRYTNSVERNIYSPYSLGNNLK